MAHIAFGRLPLLFAGALVIAAASAPNPTHAAAPRRAVLQGEFREALYEDVAQVEMPQDGPVSESAVVAALPPGLELAILGGAAVGAAIRYASASVIVGVTAGSISGEGVRALAITAGSRAASPNVCLTVMTRDGVYRASNQYALPPDTAQGETVLLPYDKSRRLSFLKRFDPTEIAVKVTDGACSTAQERAYVAYRYGAAPLRAVRIYVNSEGATDVRATFPGQPGKPCVSLRGRRTLFDYECDLTWPGAAGRTSAVLLVTREQHGRQMRPARIAIEYVSEP